MNSRPDLAYHAYWGKAQPSSAQAERYHLLPYHCLDVAACGRELLQLPRFSLKSLSEETGWELSFLEDLCVALLAVHDVGKFARSFQNLAPNLSPALVQSDPRKQSLHRHDTLGWVACSALLYRYAQAEPWFEAMELLLKIFTGHHGKPPQETSGKVPRLIEVSEGFREDDLAAAETYIRDVVAFFLKSPWPAVKKSHLAVIKRHSWALAGLAVVADWLGSNSAAFPYRAQPMSLAAYWATVALPGARSLVGQVGLHAQPASLPLEASALLPHLAALTPLQQYAQQVSFGAGPQFFLLEDVTGAGKTEAALLLCHRLMSAGNALGFYFALPTMATANQMYARVGGVYRGMFAQGASPSLVLAHGAREMVAGFRDSVLPSMPMVPDADDLSRAAAQCNAWIADSRKKALLADAGVGTVDQALLAVLPLRHQSLRLLGLSRKVLVVDEVHAYDAYTSSLLKTLIQAQAHGGGSVVLLSATVPAGLRAELIEAFQQGIGAGNALPVETEMRYPLATHVAADVLRTYACETRPEVKRRVSVVMLASEDEAEAKLLTWHRQGRAVCWIRNTVDDARKSFLRLQEKVDDEHLSLFHSRFTMGDRLDLERRVLEQFDSKSTASQRRGQVLIATQVVEQSLDLDFDELISDLAPVDLVIQRAGRLHRHVRDQDGNPGRSASRPQPSLHVLAPVFSVEPGPDWYKASFPKAAYVYPNHGKLWLTQRCLLQAGAIVTPGALGEPGSVRGLVEAVYGETGHAVPPGLQRSSNEAEGKGRGETSLASLNALKLRRGYCIEAGEWDSADRTPTRLGDETRPVYLAREADGALVPLCAPAPRIHASRDVWDLSSVRIDTYRMDALAPEWQTRFAAQLESLQQRVPLLSAAGEALVLPMIADGEGWTGSIQNNGKVETVRYETRLGLLL